MKQLIMLLACLVGLAANAQYTTVINTDSLCPIIDAPILESHLSKDYQYINTPMKLTVDQTAKYISKLGFTDLISDESLTNEECPNRYRLYKALNPETGDECWLFYSDYDTYDGIKHRVYGVSYVFKDKKTMPKNFKKLTKNIVEKDFKYIQWKNRLIICGNIGGIASLKTGKYKVPSSGGKSPYDTMPIRVIVVNK